MSAVKERIFGAVTVMSDVDAEKVWKLILDNLPTRSWNDIEEVSPDKWDQKLLNEIENDPECREFISEADAIKKLGLGDD